jgi:hypothetical protein
MVFRLYTEYYTQKSDSVKGFTIYFPSMWMFFEGFLETAVLDGYQKEFPADSTGVPEPGWSCLILGIIHRGSIPDRLSGLRSLSRNGQE